MAKDSIELTFTVDVEAYIKENNNLEAKFRTAGHVEDFNEGDVVKCTYLKGLFRVLGPNHEKIEARINVYPIDMSTEFFAVSPNYLKKEHVNANAVEVLYG
jgi:hypothetical protein